MSLNSDPIGLTHKLCPGKGAFPSNASLMCPGALIPECLGLSQNSCQGIAEVSSEISMTREVGGAKDGALECPEGLCSPPAG